MKSLDTLSENALELAATAIAACALSHCGEKAVNEQLLRSAAKLQLNTLVTDSASSPPWEELNKSPARTTDFSIVLAALLDSETAWRHVIDEVDSARALATTKFGKEFGSATDDVVDSIVDHLREEAPSRRHLPAIRARLATYRGSASLRTWLRTIILNKLRDLPSVTTELPEQVGAPSPKRDLQDEVQRAIERLPPADQVFTRLLHIYGEAQNDVAQLLKISPAAVSQRRKKIIDQLRINLTDGADTSADAEPIRPKEGTLR